MISYSLKNKLMLWLILPVIILGIVQSAIAYYLGTNYVNNAFDESLQDTASALSECLQNLGDKVVLDLPPTTKRILSYDPEDKYYYLIRDAHGNYIAGDPRLGAPTSIDTDNMRYGWIQSQKLRIATHVHPLQSRLRKRRIIVQVAKQITEREDLAQDILYSVIIPQSCLFLFIIAVVYFGVNQGLVPLGKLRQSVLNRHPQDLDPIKNTDIPREIQPFIEAINTLLQKVHHTLNAQRRFIANSAHQLKTPLAGLQAQAEFAISETNPDALHHAVTQIHQSAQRASRLTEQLLALSRLDPGASEQLKMESLDLGEITQEVLSEFVLAARKKNIELIYNGENKIALITGVKVRLFELVQNLLDNAIRYTQPNGHVIIDLLSDGSQQTLVIQDDGPGIPEDKRELVFERFYRLDEHLNNGSGLGLSIVQEIINFHHGNITITTGPKGIGTAIRATFPGETTA